MTVKKLKSARAIAVEVLNRCDPKKNYAGTILDSLRHETDQSQRATDLVFGTLRNRRAIDTVIATFSGRPVRRIEARLLNIIRVGTYELIYCPSTEQYAIVNEAVQNCRGVRRPMEDGSRTALTDKQAGFVNVVLRQITRHISNRKDGSRTAPTGRDAVLGTPYGERTLPQSPTTGCQFDTSFLPDRETRPAEYLSTVFSLPEWLVAGWLAEFGEESTRRICLASNRRPSVYLRPNRLKTTIEALMGKMADGRGGSRTAHTGFDIAGDSEMIRIKSPRNVTQLPGFADGEFTVQDITASKPVRLLDPQPGWTILDLCAAPGTKTTQLAEATGEKAKIIATDIDSRRLEMVKENTARLGIKSVDIVPYEQVYGIANVARASCPCFLPLARCQRDARPGRPRHNRFDCVLLDVPCSNTGVLARRVEARYRINPETIGQLAGIQGELLRTAAGLVRPGGKICYSTCSIQKDENSEIIESFLKENKNFTLVSQQLTLPEAEGMDHDGGYAAILAKCQTEI